MVNNTLVNKLKSVEGIELLEKENYDFILNKIDDENKKAQDIS